MYSTRIFIKLNSYSTVLFEKLLVDQLGKKFLRFWKATDKLLSSQEPVTGP